MFITELLKKSLIKDGWKDTDYELSKDDKLPDTKSLYEKVDELEKRCYNELNKNSNLGLMEYDWFEVKLHTAEHTDESKSFSNFITALNAEARNVLLHHKRDLTLNGMMRGLGECKSIVNEVVVDYSLDDIEDTEVYICIPYDEDSLPWIKIKVHDLDTAQDIEALFPDHVAITTPLFNENDLEED